MRVLVVVTGRVLTTCHHHDIRIGLLRSVRNHISLTLLGYHMPDITFLRADVIGHLIGLVTVVLVLENRSTDPFVVHAVIHSLRKDKTAVQIHADKFRSQLHRLVFHLALTVQVRITVLGHHHRVRRLVEHRSGQRTLLLRPDTVCRNTVRWNTIRQQAVCGKAVHGQYGYTVLRPHCRQAE